MASKSSTITFVDTFLGLTSLGAKPDMEQVNNAIKMDDPYEVVRVFCEANGMGREDFTASFVAPHEYSFFISGIQLESRFPRKYGIGSGEGQGDAQEEGRLWWTCRQWRATPPAAGGSRD